MAVYEYEKVAKVHSELEKMGVNLPDGNALLADSKKRHEKSKQLWQARNFAEAYQEAERSLRPLRILMRAHWEKAVRGFDTPVTSPYAVSYFTLPKHWQLMAEKAKTAVGANLLPGGDFETAPDRKQEAWRESKDSLDPVVMTADRVTELNATRVETKEVKPIVKLTKYEKEAQEREKEKEKNQPAAKKELPYQGKQCARLQIQPQPGKPAPGALERTMLALVSNDVKLPAGSLVQISGWINIPAGITASPDGALVYDNAGGDPLAIRWTNPTPWTKFTVYRRVPASGVINVTLALTGIGTVYFDDIRIEPLVPAK
jgi:hypothetical protein